MTCTKCVKLIPEKERSGYYQAFFEDGVCTAVRFYHYLGNFVFELVDEEAKKFMEVLNGAED